MKRVLKKPAVPPRPAAMGVYFGTTRLGEIVDFGKAGVDAFVCRGERRLKIGIFADRKSAAAAVSEYENCGGK